jgi:hypothetical protein
MPHFDTTSNALRNLAILNLVGHLHPFAGDCSNDKRVVGGQVGKTGSEFVHARDTEQWVRGMRTSLGLKADQVIVCVSRFA